MKDIFGNRKAVFEHLGIYVNNLEKAVASLSMLPECGEWRYVDFDFSKEIYEVGSMYKLHGAYANIGGVEYEVLEPVKDPNGIMGTHMTEFVEKHGEGLHHVAYTFKEEKDYDEAAEYMIEHGGEVIMKCELMEFEGTPKAQKTKGYYIRPENSGVIYELSIRIPVNAQT